VIGFHRISEAAELIGCSIKTVRRAIHDPEHPLPVHKIGRRLLMIAERDLQEWLAARRVVGLPSDVDHEVAEFLRHIVQPNCNRSVRGSRKRNNRKRVSGGDPLIFTQGRGAEGTGSP
jgi:excisionase family DNA binding protein